MRTLITTLIAVALLATCARAYTPTAGDRAYPLAAKDLVSGEMLSLEDELGNWVLIDVWASW